MSNFIADALIIPVCYCMLQWLQLNSSTSRLHLLASIADLHTNIPKILSIIYYKVCQHHLDTAPSRLTALGLQVFVLLWCLFRMELPAPILGMAFHLVVITASPLDLPPLSPLSPSFRFGQSFLLKDLRFFGMFLHLQCWSTAFPFLFCHCLGSSSQPTLLDAESSQCHCTSSKGCQETRCPQCESEACPQIQCSAPLLT